MLVVGCSQRLSMFGFFHKVLVAFLDELLVLSGPMHFNDSCENRVCFIDRPVERGAIGSWGPRECLLIAALRHVEIGMR